MILPYAAKSAARRDVDRALAPPPGVEIFWSKSIHYRGKRYKRRVTHDEGEGPQHWPYALPTVAAQVAAGKAARKVLRREAQGELRASGTGPVEILTNQDTTRIPELVPVRYERMLVSPFTFYRGAAALMAADLGASPHSGLTVQLCGDAHLSNFGLFASPERRLVFDLNDFDETHPGPFEWDVKRLAASFELAGREIGLSGRERHAVTTRVGRFYRESMARFAAATATRVWYAHLEMSEALLANLQEDPGKKSVAKARKVAAKARSRDSRQAVSKLIRVQDGHADWIADPPFLVPLQDLVPERDQRGLLTSMAEVLESYADTVSPEVRRLLRHYRLVGMARRVVGVGSVGTSAWVVLLVGADESDVLVLQAKEAVASVLAPYVPGHPVGHQGRRVVEGQRLMQAYGDILLGWKSADVSGFPRDYYVRQFRDWKGSFEPSGMTAQQLGIYADACSWTLARAHARSGDRIAIASYLGSSAAFDEAVATFSAAYADKTESDYERVRAAADDGRLTART